ncbi:hypothetical protein ACWIGW_41550 [Nocardia brasiliensis]
MNEYPTNPWLQKSPSPSMSHDLDCYTQEFEELFSNKIGYRPCRIELDPVEWREIIDTSRVAVEPFGCAVSDRRWAAYDGVTYIQSERHLVDREALKAVSILTNIGFVWDDLDPALKDLDALLPQLRAICERYYCEEDAYWAYQSMRSWLINDRMLEDPDLTAAMCSDMDNYTRLRLIDCGIDWWMKMSYPIYRDLQLTELSRSGLAAQLVVRPVYVVNDLYSFAREYQLGEPINCYRICETGKEHVFREFFSARLNDLRHDIDTIKAFGGVARDVMLDLIYGHFQWQIQSERFEKTVNSVNYPLT